MKIQITVNNQFIQDLETTIELAQEMEDMSEDEQAAIVRLLKLLERIK